MSAFKFIRIFILGFLCVSAAHAADFIKVECGANGWHFVKDGKPFFSMGVTTVIPVDEPPKDRADKGHYDGLAAHGGDVNAWARHTGERLTAWGLNTLGGWSSPVIEQQSNLYFTRVLSFGWYGNAGNRLMDVFSAEYAAGIEASAVKEVAPLANEPRLLGYFTNNELNWHGEHGWPTDTDDSLLDRYLALPATAAGRVHLLKWLSDYFKADYAAFEDAFECNAKSWGELAHGAKLKPRRFRVAQTVKYAWAGEVAEKYFSLCEEAIHRHDRNHLILGCRFAGSGIIEVLKAQARHCDVLSVNRYDKNGNAPLEMFDQLYALTDKPIILGEFGWRAMENRSGLKNTHGVDVTVPTQRDRAERLERFATALMARPYMVGMHWFQHHDEPTNGRFDGEDSNYGIFDHRDVPYEEVTAAFTKLTAQINSATWKRDAFPPADMRRGWPEHEALTLAAGVLPAAANLLPSNNERWRAAANCDSAHGARLTIEPAADGAWVCSYDTGSGWGVSPGFMPSKEAKFAGAKKLHIKLQAPRDVLWRVLLTESGANSGDDKGLHGADGESFSSAPFKGTGAPQEMTLWLEDFLVRWEYGNQKGNRRLDLDGLANIAIAVPEAGQKGELRILTLELLP